ncbi:MAG TPA: hypothetical protein VFH66_07490 [Mycobacteriales bacterium]|nr:hypothetical protein [Mycobacteriales bacterium]
MLCSPAPSSSTLALPLQRMSRDELAYLWRRTVDHLTEMSVELHSLRHDAPLDHVESVESRLAETRRTLVEIELAMQRLRLRGA